MHTRKSFTLVYLAPFLVLALGVSGSEAVEEEEGLLASDTLQTEHLTYISRSGTEIVTHLENARAALDRNDRMKARWETAQARSILGRLREKSPPLRLQDRIAAALRDLRSGSKPKPQTLLPIYAELDAVQNTEQVAEVREYVDKARAGVERGEVEEAADSLVEASARIRYLEIDLPIEQTYGSLTRAMLQIQDKQMLAAKSTLRDAEKHITGFVAIASSAMEQETEAVGAGPE